MIDPIHSLAFSLQANPGVYAVLLGSGVSRSAGIPTGWEITIDLVRKLAQVCGEACTPSPEAWYANKYGKAPDYSDLLDALAQTPSERQQLLRAYLEPSEAEREDGVKAPTPAHRAIADLAAKGYIRVVITTNFDRLMEMALADAGVVPTVISSTDHINGALPLIHTRCCVIKVHGDYLDTRILNTPAELAAYPQELNALLDRVFDEFGLVVCGWSADWDFALRSAIVRSTSRRFSQYWAARGEPSTAAADLVSHRQAQVIRIADSDSFFGEITRLVMALEQFSRPHPLSKEAAVASLKVYLTEAKHRIRFADLIAAEVEKLIQTMGGTQFAVQGAAAPDRNSFNMRIKAYQAASETLIALGEVGGCWAEDWHHSTWSGAISRISAARADSGIVLWLELQRYPATLLLYALGIGAMQAGTQGLKLLGTLLSVVIHREHKLDKTVAELLPPFCLFENGSDPAKLLEGMDRRRAPLNDWLHDLLKGSIRNHFPSSSAFTMAFDKLEILLALGNIFQAKRSEAWNWAPPGCYGYRSDNTRRVLEEIRTSLQTEAEASPYVASRIFGSSLTECLASLDLFEKFLTGLAREWRF